VVEKRRPRKKEKNKTVGEPITPRKKKKKKEGDPGYRLDTEFHYSQRNWWGGIAERSEKNCNGKTFPRAKNKSDSLFSGNPFLGEKKKREKPRGKKRRQGGKRKKPSEP